jgi:hypothetical protein
MMRTAHTGFWPCALDSSLGIWQQKISALTALMFGRPGFFTPRTVLDWFSIGNLVSYYDTSVLKVARWVDVSRQSDRIRRQLVSVAAAARDKARDLRAGVYGSLTEGLDTLDLNSQSVTGGFRTATTLALKIPDVSRSRARYAHLDQRWVQLRGAKQ